MAETKHTSGPWEYREIAPYDDGIGYISADGHDIIHAGVSDLPAEENRANAHLIAAAPDLLAALIECRKQVATIIDDGTPTDWQAWLDDLTAAIARAEVSSHA